MFTPDQQISDIVTTDYRAAGVFKQHGIDFCCGGHIPLSEVCEKKGLNQDELINQLSNLYTTPDKGMDFASWPISRLIDFIVGYHHGYVRDAVPRIQAFAQKVAWRHGETQPELVELFHTFNQLAAELTDHANDEEQRVFPVIRALANGEELPNREELSSMVNELETEHAVAGAALGKLRELTNGFNPPDWACNTYRILFKELEAFETDLHQHVHLENNILFPKAWTLFKEASATS